MVVTLSRDAWHVRLQDWTFPTPPNFNSLCPHFWCTVFCLIVLPVTLLFKLLFLVGRALYDALGSILDPIVGLIGRLMDTRLARFFERRTRALSDFEAYRLWKELADFNALKRAYYEGAAAVVVRVQFWEHRLFNPRLLDEARAMWEAWSSAHPAWEALFKASAERFDAMLQEERRVLEKLKARSADRRERWKRAFGYIALYTRDLLVVPIAGVLLGFIGAGLALFVRFVFRSWHLIDWLTVLKAIGIILGVGAGVFVVALFVMLLGNLTFLKGGFRWVGDQLADAFGLFIDYARAAKENVCPHIKWVDPTKKGEG